MKDEWSNYFASIGITGLFFKRAEEILNFYQKVYPDQVQDVFVNEYLDKEANRQYESLWLFSEQFVMEAKQFVKEDDFDCAPLSKQVKYWCIKKTEYDFDRATAKSRLVLQLTLGSGTSCNLKASQENCDQLKTLFFKYIVPNAM
jgi:hypothetical protein